ncbi:helix-turn-helix domain-containing protein [Bradyrhizobium sp. KBS0727]|nr:helix-turn-helix domain-containing protein [Bradyrhizobium sp. KBS0725]QDW46713.1 helix-turn-helix domain-containing protein [Bradyrhizobium sp. KBS0727]
MTIRAGATVPSPAFSNARPRRPARSTNVLQTRGTRPVTMRRRLPIKTRPPQVYLPCPSGPRPTEAPVSVVLEIGPDKADRLPERGATTTRCPQGQYAGISSCGVLAPGRTFCCVLAICGATMRIHLSANMGTQTLSAQSVSSCRDLVERAEVLALAEVDEPLQISALCAALSVSERTLRKAFHGIRGLPPCRHLRMLRLSQARRALMDTDSGLSTVTEIATGFGFLELGRFSVEYRRAFGESPSQTLQRTSSASAHMVRTAEHEDRVEFYV